MANSVANDIAAPAPPSTHPFVLFRSHKTERDSLSHEYKVLLCKKQVKNAPPLCLNINRKTTPTKCNCMQIFLADNLEYECAAIAEFLVNFFDLHLIQRHRMVMDWVKYSEQAEDKNNNKPCWQRFFVPAHNYESAEPERNILQTHLICKNALAYLLNFS